MSMFDSDLMRDYVTECAFMDKTTKPDGYGGYTQEWTEGAHFDAVILKNNEEAVLASGAADNTTYYGVKVEKQVPLEFRTVFKRMSDGKTFRVKADEGMTTPSFSPMNIKQMPIEEWKIPEGSGE